MSATPLSTQNTVTKPQIELGQDMKEALGLHLQSAGQVVVHCQFKAQSEVNMIRIWPSTVLIDRHSGHRSELLHRENISLYPFWTLMSAGETLHFTLVFSGLPKSCTTFDFWEDIPEPGGFEIKGIARNKSDVYHVDLSAQ